MTATESPDADTLFASTLRAQLVHLHTTLSRQMNAPAFLLKPSGPAIRTKTTPQELIKSIQLQLHKQLVDSHATAPISKAILISPNSTQHFCAPPTQQRSLRRGRSFFSCASTLPHPTVPDPLGVAAACPNKSSSGQICTRPVDAHQHLCYGCLADADVIQTHSGAKNIEKTMPSLARVGNNQVKHARMDLVFDPHVTTTSIDVAVVTPFSSKR